MKRTVLGIVGAAALTLPACSAEHETQTDQRQSDPAPAIDPDIFVDGGSGVTIPEDEFNTDDCQVGDQGWAIEVINGTARNSNGHITYSYSKQTNVDLSSSGAKIIIDGKDADLKISNQTFERVPYPGDETPMDSVTYGSFEIPQGTSVVRIENVPNGIMPGEAGVEPCVLELNISRESQVPQERNDSTQFVQVQCETQDGQSSEDVVGTAQLQNGVVQYGYTRYAEPEDIQGSPEVVITANGKGFKGSADDQRTDEILLPGETTRRGFDTWGSFEVPSDTSTIRIENAPIEAMPGVTFSDPCVLEFQITRAPITRRAQQSL